MTRIDPTNSPRRRGIAPRCLAVPAALALVAAAAHAQFSIPWSTVDGGGGVSVGGSFSVEGTAGQFDVGSGQSGGTFCVVTAYWEGGRLSSQCPGDLNADNSVDTLDLVLFLGQFGNPSPCGGGADFNFDGLVNTIDLTVFLGNFSLNCS
ncbi:MAG: GC-type dockerin domain-anchored protein [Phycisphaerales bacterium]